MSLHKPSNKILVVLPFWAGDQEQHKKLVRLISDLEPAHSIYADLLFVPRFDCAVYEAVVKHAYRKFNVFSYTSKRRETGWPRGCNAIAFSAFEWVYHKMLAGQIPGYKAIFMMGADTTPFRRGWIEALSHEWEVLNKNKRICMAGALLPATSHGREHINGDCCLLTGDLTFLKWLAVTVGGVDVCAGWDWTMAEDFRARGWANIPFIKSYWRKEGFSEVDWEHQIKSGTVLFHGIKSDCLLDMVRRKLL